MAAVEKYYPKDQIKIIEIKLSEEESVKRNSKRRVCEKNGHPVLDVAAEVCPEDGSPIILRPDDAPAIIKERYQIYLSRTQPVIDFLIKKGYNLVTIDGEKPIEDVHRDILNKLW